MKKALPVSEYHKKKFEKYMADLGEKATYTQLKGKCTDVKNLLRRKKVQGVQL